MNGSERGGDKGWDLRPAGNAGVTKLPSAIHWARNVTCRAEGNDNMPSTPQE